MPLADKIIELRKKQGWSQIDLADRLDVSRQSVSKWEMAQAVPELDKIIKMSELFAVTTDYLLKDDVPGPEPVPQPGPEVPAQATTAPGEEPPAPVPEPDPAKKSRKKRPWVLAAAFCLAASVTLLLWAVGAGRQDAPANTPFPFEPTPTPAPQAVEEAVMAEPTPSPSPATVFLDEAAEEVTVPRTGAPSPDDTVTEEPALEQTAVSDPGAPEAAMTEYTYEGSACTAGGIDPKALTAIAAEYEPFGVTCDVKNGQWYFEGEPIRVFTDILTSNGESLTGGRFQGTMRNFAGDGTVDVRTVRDYEHCGEDGCGTLLYLETCNVRQEDAHWVEHPAEEHHGDRHE